MLSDKINVDLGRGSTKEHSSEGVTTYSYPAEFGGTFNMTIVNEPQPSTNGVVGRDQYEEVRARPDLPTNPVDLKDPAELAIEQEGLSVFELAKLAATQKGRRAAGQSATEVSKILAKVKAHERGLKHANGKPKGKGSQTPIYKRAGSPYWWMRGPFGRISSKVPHENLEEPPEDSIVHKLYKHLFDQHVAKKMGMGDSASNMELRIEHWIDRWWQKESVDMPEATRSLREYAIKRYLKWLKKHKRELALDHLDCMTRRDCRQFVDEELAGLHSVTKRSIKGTLSIIWEGALDYGYAKSNPWKGIRIPTTREEAEAKAAKRTHLTLAELQRILTAPESICSRRWKIMFTIGIYTGARISSVRAIKWGDVDLKARALTFKKSKTGRYTVPMHPVLVKSFEQWHQECIEEHPMNRVPKPEDSIFNIGVHVWKGHRANTLSSQATKIMRDLGIEGVTFHSLRHTFVSLLANFGVDKRQAQLLSNHKSESIHDIYTHAEAWGLQNAMSSIPDLAVTPEIEVGGVKKGAP